MRYLTTVYGRITTWSPTLIYLEEISGNVIRCVVTPEIAEKLYNRRDRIGVEGWATLDETGRIATLEITTVLPYVEIPLTEAFRKLAEAAGPDPWRNPDDHEEEGEETNEREADGTARN